MVCLETDFLVALMRKDRNALTKLKELVEKGERLATTPINAAEALQGSVQIEKRRRKPEGQGDSEQTGSARIQPNRFRDLQSDNV